MQLTIIGGGHITAQATQHERLVTLVPEMFAQLRAMGAATAAASDVVGDAEVMSKM